jgi:hypothetical protein
MGAKGTDMPTTPAFENAPPICVACGRTANLFIGPGQTTLWKALGPVVKDTGAVAMLCPECQEQGNTASRFELVDAPA